jgi:hypothetical protein
MQARERKEEGKYPGGYVFTPEKGPALNPNERGTADRVHHLQNIISHLCEQLTELHFEWVECSVCDWVAAASEMRECHDSSNIMVCEKCGCGPDCSSEDSSDCSTDDDPDSSSGGAESELAPAELAPAKLAPAKLAPAENTEYKESSDEDSEAGQDAFRYLKVAPADSTDIITHLESMLRDLNIKLSTCSECGWIDGEWTFTKYGDQRTNYCCGDYCGNYCRACLEAARSQGLDIAD